MKLTQTLALPILLASTASAQTYVLQPGDIPSGNPNNSSTTEDIDLADVDLDGDWDAAMADGGDIGNDQNRLWINEGGAQGGTIGVFVDATVHQFPSINDDSRDVEFLDYDGDGDYDLYISNTAQISNQGDRFWDNIGGAQGGMIGFYVDATDERWINIGGPGSSIPASHVLAFSGNFIDWSCESDFADLDADGHQDLFHGSYGGAMGGQVPSRIFLNDGDGHFEEFNPSGFQLISSNLQNGQPGLWCNGTQQHLTTDATGAFCDVATAVENVELFDFDGDLDVDILMGSLHDTPRMFQNLLEEQGTFGFRDVTSIAFQAGSILGSGHYDEEAADLDNDDDVDLYGLNWLQQPTNFGDAIYENAGNGMFGAANSVPGSGSDDQQADYVDYDNDGDLDVVISNFSGQNRLYRNRLIEDGAGFSFASALDDVTFAEMPIHSMTSLDVDAVDVDGDGDYDLFEGNEPNAPNHLYINTSQIPDTTAPRAAHIEELDDGAAHGGVDVLRTHIYDNAPYYITWYDDVDLIPTVDGIELAPRPMVSSGAQVFRGELPGNFVGAVEARVRASDEYGNTSLSAPVSATRTGVLGTEVGGSSPSSVGTPSMRSLTEPHAGSPLVLVGEGVAPGAFLVLGFSLTDLGASGVDIGDGIVLNLGLPLLGPPLFAVADANGRLVLELPAAPPFPGTAFRTQMVALDGAVDTWASSRARVLTLQ